MIDQSRSYYARRAEEERLAAVNASDERAAQSHRELAVRYLELSDGAGLPPTDDAAAQIRIVSKDFRIVP
jgi:hypothetical protein